MKKLLFIALLMPSGLMAQKDTGTIDFHTDSSHFGWVTHNDKKWSIMPSCLPTRSLSIIDNTKSNKILMEVDTSGILHVYGDTLSILKAIIKAYGIKLKNQ